MSQKLCYRLTHRLTRPEFERRYQAMTQLKKAELIAGVVYMASPVRIKNHGNPHARIITWLGYYWYVTPGVELADNTTDYCATGWG